MDTREYEKPGHYFDVPEDVYNAIPAVRQSSLAEYEVSDQHYLWSLKQPERQSNPMKMGSALHAYVLEPQVFLDRYELEPDHQIYGRLKVTKKQKAEDPNHPGLLAANPRGTEKYKAQKLLRESLGWTVLDETEWNKVYRMGKALRNQEDTAKLLANAKGTEVVCVWLRDSILCKAKLDLAGSNWIVDLKTTKDIPGFLSTSEKRGEWEKYGGERQGAWYADGAVCCGLMNDLPDFYLAVVGNEGAHETLWAKVSESALVCGKMELDHLWGRHLACVSSGEWAPRYNTPQSASVSDWLFNSVAEQAQGSV